MIFFHSRFIHFFKQFDSGKVKAQWLDQLRTAFESGVEYLESQAPKGQVEFMWRLYNAQYAVQEEAVSSLNRKCTNFTKAKGRSIMNVIVINMTMIELMCSNNYVNILCNCFESSI
jgi:hypothetical protein